MREGTVEANGLRFAYVEEGEGPLVLLLHGFPDNALTWDRVMPALAEAGTGQRRLLRPAQRHLLVGRKCPQRPARR